MPAHVGPLIPERAEWLRKVDGLDQVERQHVQDSFDCGTSPIAFTAILGRKKASRLQGR